MNSKFNPMQAWKNEVYCKPEELQAKLAEVPATGSHRICVNAAEGLELHEFLNGIPGRWLAEGCDGDGAGENFRWYPAN